VPNAGRVIIKLGGKLSAKNAPNLTLKVSTNLGGTTNQEWKGVVNEGVCVTYDKTINSLEPVTFTLEDTQKKETFCILEIQVEKYHPVLQVWPPIIDTTHEATWKYEFEKGDTKGFSVDIEAVRLLEDITVTAPTNFLISKDGVTFVKSLTLTKDAQNKVKTTIYARFENNLEQAVYSHVLDVKTSQHESNGCGSTKKSNNVMESVALVGSVWLPIELIAFNAQVVNNVVALDWATASEENNDYFTLSRSVNGVAFEELTQISGVGTTIVMQQYSYNDENPLAGISYYRLSQTDYNGKLTHSGVVPVQYSAQTPSFEIVKHTSNGVTTLNVLFPASDAANYISIHSLQGLTEYETVIPAGTQSFNIDVTLASGVYVVHNVYKGEKKSVKIMVN
jgi:hypothetical protein